MVRRRGGREAAGAVVRSSTTTNCFSAPNFDAARPGPIDLAGRKESARSGLEITLHNFISE